jgi:hypothetical protein
VIALPEEGESDEEKDGGEEGAPPALEIAGSGVAHAGGRG